MQKKTEKLEWEGRLLSFQEMSWPMLQASRGLLEDIATFVSTLLNERTYKNAQGQTFENVKRGNDSADNTTVSEMSVDLVKLMVNQRREAAKSLVGAFLGQTNAELLNKIILDACPGVLEDVDAAEIFGDDGLPKKEYVRRLNRLLRAPDVFLMLTKIVQVNTRMLGEAGKQMVDKIRSRVKEEVGVPTTAPSESTSSGATAGVALSNSGISVSPGV